MQENVQPPNNYPEIQVENLLKMQEEVRFFEEAMDWRNMTYEFYPYFWGRKNRWLDVFPLEDKDPLFQEFLRAGMARVLVPVNLSHTQAVLYYQLTGHLWPGGPVPLFSPPDFESDFVAPDAPPNQDEEFLEYQAYVAELSDVEANDDIEKEVEVSPGDPDAWEIKIPTDLVWLQQEQTLPDLEADEE